MAVDYNKKFYIGKITGIELLILDSQKEMVDITYLSKPKNGKYKWLRKQRHRHSPDLVSDIAQTARSLKLKQITKL